MFTGLPSLVYPAASNCRAPAKSRCGGGRRGSRARYGLLGDLGLPAAAETASVGVRPSAAAARGG